MRIIIFWMINYCSLRVFVRVSDPRILIFRMFSSLVIPIVDFEFMIILFICFNFRTPSPKEIQIVVKNDHVKQAKTDDLSSIYSNPSLISSIDRKAFEAPSFTMGFIPVVAPSADLC